MTTPSPPIPSLSDGSTLAIGNLNAYWNLLVDTYGRLQGGQRNRKPLCVLNITAFPLSIGGGVSFVPSWDTVTLDTDNMFVAGFSTCMIVRTPGWYRVVCRVHWDNTNGGNQSLQILYNGTNPSTNSTYGSDYRPSTTSGEGTTVQTTTYLACAANSQIYTYVRQGGTARQQTITNLGGSTFSAEWVAPLGSS